MDGPELSDLPPAVGLATPIRRRASREASARRLRAVTAVVLYGTVAVVVAVIAYRMAFSGWQAFDDEGFFDYSLKTLLTGHSLYNSTYSEYGPFYYLVFGGLFKLTGVAVTLDAGRFITVAVWLICSLGFALAAYSFTRSVAIGVVVAISISSLLGELDTGPMHAQVLVVLLTMLIGATVIVWLPRSWRSAPWVLGGLIAALMLTKVNLGAYAFVAVAFTAVIAGPYRRWRWLVIVAAGSFVLLGPILMASEWHIAEQFRYSLAVALSSLALVVVVWPRSEAEGVDIRVLVRLGGGFLLTTVLLLLLMVAALGSSVGAWFNQTVATPLHQASFLQLSMDITPTEVAWGALGVCAAAACRWYEPLRQIPIRWSLASSGVARIVLAIGTLGASAYLSPFHTPYPYWFAWPTAWVVAIPAKATMSPLERFARIMLVALAISQSLMAYPVAGAQVRLGGLLFVLWAAVCLVDGANDLKAWADRRERTGWRGREWTTAGIAALYVGLAAWFGYYATIDGLRTTLATYDRGTPLGLHGAQLIRVSPADAEGLSEVTRELHRQHCQYLMGIPAQLSINLLSGLDTPDPLTGQQPYWLSLSGSQQRQVLATARAAPGLCLTRDAAAIAFYMGHRQLPTTALMSYLQRDFVSVGQYGEWTVEVRRRG